MPPTANMHVYCGVFLIALATMLFEVLLTRVFSVTTFYHFAFLSISAAMLGLARGAVWVYKKPDLSSGQDVYKAMGYSALLFALLSLVSVCVHLCTPLIVGFAHPKITLVCSIAFAFPVILLAFVASGVCICLAVTRFPNAVNRIYAFDLCGAAFACIAMVCLLNYIDVFAGFLGVALCSAVAGAMFLTRQEMPGARRVAYAAAAVLSLLIGAQIMSAESGHPLIRLFWSKGEREQALVYEKWNAFSRIRIFGDRDKRQPWVDPALASKTASSTQVASLTLDIDANADTQILHWDGNPKTASFLSHATTAVPHILRNPGDVAIIGVGGGKEVLTAIVMQQKSVLGLEINQSIIGAVTGLLGDYSGHFDRIPGVKIVCDDARSAITGSPDKFDVIQASNVDTWAASASGAYALTESSLYTLNCWRTLLEHTKPRGIVTMTRWFEPEAPTEFYRLTNMAADALRQSGVTEPRAHMIALRNKPLAPKGLYSIGTLMISPAPFSAEDLRIVDDLCRNEGFEAVLTPVSSTDPVMAGLAGKSHREVVASFPFNLKSPTDDSPFFFQTLRLDNLLNQLTAPGANAMNVQAGIVPFGAVLIILLSVITMLRIRSSVARDWKLPADQAAITAYFFLIGLGFMLIEISQMQRLIIFLGHPNFGLSVALFSFLLGGALGSLLAGTIRPDSQRDIHLRFGAAILILIGSGLVCVPLLSIFSSWSMPVRIAVAIAAIFPVGFVLGMPFPLGMSIVNLRYRSLSAWLWGLNGVASVMGSFLAVALSMTIGISATFWVAALIYFLAYAAAIYALKRPVSVEESEHPAVA